MRSGNYWERWCRGWSFWWYEMRVILELRYSCSFKRFCEKRDCPNLASLEEEYIQEVRKELADLRRRRAAFKEAKNG